jgi:ribosome-binding protein aMBF1 (putative translation factor)
MVVTMVSSSGPRRRFASVRPSKAADDPDDTQAFAVRVGEGVRRARQSHGWTQAELAERAGLSSNYVARLERGELGPSLFVANRLCDTLGIDVSELLQGSAAARTGRRRIAT